MVSQIVIIPNIPLLVRDKKYIPLLTFVSLAYMFMVWYILLSANTGGVLPYKFGGWHLFTLLGLSSSIGGVDI